MKFTHKPFLTTLFHVVGFVLRGNHFLWCFRGPKVDMSRSAKSSKNRIFRLILVRQQTETIQLFVPNNLNEKKCYEKNQIPLCFAPWRLCFFFCPGWCHFCDISLHSCTNTRDISISRQLPTVGPQFFDQSFYGP